MDKIFVDGLIAKEPHEKVRAFVKVKLAFKVDEFKKFLTEHAKNGWVNTDVKVSKGGKWYAELDTYERNKDVEEVKQEIRDMVAPVEDDGITSAGYNNEEIRAADILF